MLKNDESLILYVLKISKNYDILLVFIGYLATRYSHHFIKYLIFFIKMVIIQSNSRHSRVQMLVSP
jgi:hypothetical protein